MAHHGPTFTTWHDQLSNSSVSAISTFGNPPATAGSYIAWPPPSTKPSLTVKQAIELRQWLTNHHGLDPLPAELYRIFDAAIGEQERLAFQEQLSQLMSQQVDQTVLIKLLELVAKK